LGVRMGVKSKEMEKRGQKSSSFGKAFLPKKRFVLKEKGIEIGRRGSFNFNKLFLPKKIG